MTSSSAGQEEHVRIGNLSGRLVIRSGAGVVDVQRASQGAVGADPQAVYDQWDELVGWAASTDLPEGDPFEETDLGPPVPRPRQVFGIALNYRDHAAETGAALPEQPLVFTKFPSAITGPYGEIRVPDGNVDWEVELVVVIGRRAWQVGLGEAWSYVAGLTVGQDLSERLGQFAGASPQFSLAKSHPGFGPMGPWLVTADEVPDPDDLALGCRLNGEQMQQSRTSQLVFPVAELVARLSAVLPLLPGDVIFTGTPAGVGGTRRPPRFLHPGDELVSQVEGIGEMRHRFVAG
jgi:2,4-didehydro-3-deoxy-L-rhamnonate hydrolase